jgi:hypothetical protein
MMDGCISKQTRMSVAFPSCSSHSALGNDTGVLRASSRRLVCLFINPPTYLPCMHTAPTSIAASLVDPCLDAHMQVPFPAIDIGHPCAETAATSALDVGVSTGESDLPLHHPVFFPYHRRRHRRHRHHRHLFPCPSAGLKTQTRP